MISFQTLALLINIAIVLAVGIWALRRRDAPGAMALVVLCVFVAIWSAIYLLVDDPRLSQFRLYAAATVYFSAVLAASAAFWLVAVRTNRGRWVNARNAALLAIMPVLTQVLFWSQRAPNSNLDRSCRPRIAQLFFAGPWERILALYIFGLAATGAVLLADALLQRRRPLASRLGSAFLGSTLPLIALLVESAGRSPFPGLELLPFAFGIAALAWAYGLFGLRPEEIGSIDRAAAVERMEEGWIVLDANNTILDMNSAAERLSGFTRQQVYGQPISSVLGDLDKLGTQFQLQPGSGDEEEHSAGGGLEIPEHPDLAADGPESQSLWLADAVARHDRAQAHRRLRGSGHATRCSCCSTPSPAQPAIR